MTVFLLSFFLISFYEIENNEKEGNYKKKEASYHSLPPILYKLHMELLSHYFYTRNKVIHTCICAKDKHTHTYNNCVFKLSINPHALLIFILIYTSLYTQYIYYYAYML